ncbi:carboxypeptidase regulatory-like domain-containing protein [Terriglobus sp. 2YAB30_2]|uniref:carboxypeptidase regulatory-like domain-containing protein n=1 Tax=unclassified Terriglobus TaxID=2628988 RepID=UPI003F963FBE
MTTALEVPLLSRLFRLSLVFLLLPYLALAQQTSTIVGTVSDSSGAAIPDAVVSLVDTATGFQRTVTSNAEGQYTAASIPAGSYRISVEKPGFQRLERSNITLAAAATADVDLALSVGSNSETVTVSESASLLQSQSGVVSSLVDSKQVVALPLATRNFTDLVLLTPGAHTGSASNLAEGGSAYAIRGGSNFSVNGSIAAANSYLIDGIYDRNQWLNTLVLVPIVDSIQEYRVMTSNFNAEFGEAAGAITTVSTKSGSNRFHGSVWEFLRNDIMNANSYFAKQNNIRRAPYRRNTFGATLGGPIVRERTFFFADYQGIRQSVPQTYTTTLPTLAQRAMVRTGNFAGFGTQLYNPYSTTTVGGATTRAAFAGNQVPTSLLDPAAVKFVDLLPTPTNGNATNNYTITPALTQNTNQFDARIDQNLGAGNRLFFKYSFDQTEQVSPGTVATASSGVSTVGPYIGTGGNGTRTPVRTQSGTLGYSHVLSPATLLEAHAALVRWRAEVTPLGQGFAAATALGIPGINYNALAGGLPGITISNFSALGDTSSYPENSYVTTFQYDGDAIHTAGKHTFKAGVLFLRHRFNGFSAFPVRGTYDFNGQFTRQTGSTSAASSLADFALGATDAANRNILTGEFGMRTFQLAPYIQDTWRATDRLTLEYGARYEISAPPYEVHNHWANFDVPTGTLRVAGLNGNGRRLRNFDWKTFAPRAGLAYSLDSQKNTVLRAGFGISFVDTLAGGAQLYKNLPYYFAQTITTDSAAAPSARLSDGFSTPVQPDPNNTAAISTGSPTAWDVNTRQTGVYQYSLGLQRQIRQDLIAEVSYVGTRSQHLLINSLNLNQSRPGAGAQNIRRPYYTINPNLVNVAYRTGAGDASYNSLQVHVEKRTTKGLNFGASYTYAKYLSDAGNPNGGGNGDIQDHQCIRCNWGSTPDDFRHTFVFNHVYELPFGRGRQFLSHGPVSYIVGPWNFSGVWSLHSGSPFTVFYGTNVANSSGGGTQRPNRIGSGRLSSGRTAAKYFDTSAFVAPALYTFGNSGTGILTGPGYFNVDLTLERRFAITERVSADLRGETFNTFNRANFNNPNATIGTATAGVISGTQSPRVMQVALKISF